MSCGNFSVWLGAWRGKKKQPLHRFLPESTRCSGLVWRFRSKEGKQNQHSRILYSVYILHVSASLEFTFELAARQDTADSLGRSRERLMVQQFNISTSGSKQAGEGQLLLLLGTTLSLLQAASYPASMSGRTRARGWSFCARIDSRLLIVSLFFVLIKRKKQLTKKTQHVAIFFSFCKHYFIQCL